MEIEKSLKNDVITRSRVQKHCKVNKKEQIETQSKTNGGKLFQFLINTQSCAIPSRQILRKFE